MRIKLLLNIGTCETEYPHLKEGEHDVSEAVAKKLAERGWAEILAVPPAKEMKAVPPVKAPEIQQATAKPEPVKQKTPSHKEQ